MVKLILELDDNVVNELPLIEESITIGRHGSNTIPVNHLAVSRFHARFDRIGSEYAVTDLQSTNGTFVNDEHVVNRILSHGDRILVGKHVITFLDPENEDKRKEKTDEKNTLLNSTSELSIDERLELVADNKDSSIPSNEEKPIGVLNSVDSSGLGEIELREKHTRVGKDFFSDIRLQGLFIGKSAAIISRKQVGYIITFVGGISKLKVNGQVVKSSTPLNEFDVIKIGSYMFQFCYNQ